MAVTRSRSDRVYNVFGLESYANVGIGQRSGIRWEAPPTVHVDVGRSSDLLRVHVGG